MGRVVSKAEVLIVQYSPIRVLPAWLAAIIRRLPFNCQWFPMACLRAILALIMIVLVVLPDVAKAELSYLVHGVDDPLETNVLNHISTLQLGPQARLSEKRCDQA